MPADGPHPVAEEKKDKSKPEIPVVGALERLPHLRKIHLPEGKIHESRADQQADQEFEVILFNHNMSHII